MLAHRIKRLFLSGVLLAAPNLPFVDRLPMRAGLAARLHLPVRAENDATCACCDSPVCLDEDYELTVALTVPAGAGSYQLCAARDVCTFDGSGCIT